MAALHHVFSALSHVVSQVVEPELVVRAVGDIGGVLFASLVWGLAGEDTSDADAEEAVDASHQL